MSKLENFKDADEALQALQDRMLRDKQKERTSFLSLSVPEFYTLDGETVAAVGTIERKGCRIERRGSRAIRAVEFYPT